MLTLSLNRNRKKVLIFSLLNYSLIPNAGGPHPNPHPHPTFASAFGPPPPSIICPLSCDVIRQVWLLPRWIHLDTRLAPWRVNPKVFVLLTLCCSISQAGSQEEHKALQLRHSVPPADRDRERGRGRPKDGDRRGRR